MDEIGHTTPEPLEINNEDPINSLLPINLSEDEVNALNEEYTKKKKSTS